MIVNKIFFYFIYYKIYFALRRLFLCGDVDTGFIVGGGVSNSKNYSKAQPARQLNLPPQIKTDKSN